MYYGFIIIHNGRFEQEKISTKKPCKNVYYSSIRNDITNSPSRTSLLRCFGNPIFLSTIPYLSLSDFFCVPLLFLFFSLYLPYFQLKDVLSLYRWRSFSPIRLFLCYFHDKWRLLGLFALFRPVIQ